MNLSRTKSRSPRNNNHQPIMESSNLDPNSSNDGRGEGGTNSSSDNADFAAAATTSSNFAALSSTTAAHHEGQSSSKSSSAASPPPPTTTSLTTTASHTTTQQQQQLSPFTRGSRDIRRLHYCSSHQTRHKQQKEQQQQQKEQQQQQQDASTTAGSDASSSENHAQQQQQQAYNSYNTSTTTSGTGNAGGGGGLPPLSPSPKKRNESSSSSWSSSLKLFSRGGGGEDHQHHHEEHEELQSHHHHQQQLQYTGGRSSSPLVGALNHHHQGEHDTYHHHHHHHANNYDLPIVFGDPMEVGSVQTGMSQQELIRKKARSESKRRNERNKYRSSSSSVTSSVMNGDSNGGNNKNSSSSSNHHHNSSGTGGSRGNNNGSGSSSSSKKKRKNERIVNLPPGLLLSGVFSRNSHHHRQIQRKKKNRSGTGEASGNKSSSSSPSTKKSSRMAWTFYRSSEHHERESLTAETDTLTDMSGTANGGAGTAGGGSNSSPNHNNNSNKNYDLPYSSVPVPPVVVNHEADGDGWYPNSSSGDNNNLSSSSAPEKTTITPLPPGGMMSSRELDAALTAAVPGDACSIDEYSFPLLSTDAAVGCFEHAGSMLGGAVAMRGAPGNDDESSENHMNVSDLPTAAAADHAIVDPPNHSQDDGDGKDDDQTGEHDGFGDDVDQQYSQEEEASATPLLPGRTSPTRQQQQQDTTTALVSRSVRFSKTVELSTIHCAEEFTAWDSNNVFVGPLEGGEPSSPDHEEKAKDFSSPKSVMDDMALQQQEDGQFPRDEQEEGKSQRCSKVFSTSSTSKNRSRSSSWSSSSESNGSRSSGSSQIKSILRNSKFLPGGGGSGGRHYDHRRPAYLRAYLAAQAQQALQIHQQQQQSSYSPVKEEKSQSSAKDSPSLPTGSAKDDKNALSPMLQTGITFVDQEGIAFVDQEGSELSPIREDDDDDDVEMEKNPASRVDDDDVESEKVHRITKKSTGAGSSVANNKHIVEKLVQQYDEPQPQQPQQHKQLLPKQDSNGTGTNDTTISSATTSSDFLYPDPSLDMQHSLMTTDDEQTVHTSRMAFIEAVAAVVIQTGWRRYLGTRTAEMLRKRQRDTKLATTSAPRRLSPPRNADTDATPATSPSPPRRNPQQKVPSSPETSQSLGAWKTRQQQLQQKDQQQQQHEPVMQDTANRQQQDSVQSSRELAGEPYDVAAAFSTQKPAIQEHDAKTPALVTSSASPPTTPPKGKPQESTPSIGQRWQQQQQQLAKSEPVSPPRTDRTQEQVSPRKEPMTVAVATATALLQKSRAPDPLIEKRVAEVQKRTVPPTSPPRVQQRALPPRPPTLSKLGVLDQKQFADSPFLTGAQMQRPVRRLPKGDERIFEDMAMRMYVEAAVRIQSVFRGFWVRDCLNVDHYCATVIQKSFRGLICLVDYQYDLYRIMVVQSVWRMNIAKRRASRVLRSIIMIQATIRRFLATKLGMRKKLVHDETVHVKDTAATSIQTAFRQYSAELILIRTLVDVLITQSVARGWLARQKAAKYRYEKRLALRNNVVARYRFDATRTTTQEWDASGAESATLNSLSLDSSDDQVGRRSLGSFGSREDNSLKTIQLTSPTKSDLDSVQEEKPHPEPENADSNAADTTTLNNKIDTNEHGQDKSDVAVINYGVRLTTVSSESCTYTQSATQDTVVKSRSHESYFSRKIPSSQGINTLEDKTTADSEPEIAKSGSGESRESQRGAETQVPVVQETEQEKELATDVSAKAAEVVSSKSIKADLGRGASSPLIKPPSPVISSKSSTATVDQEKGLKSETIPGPCLPKTQEPSPPANAGPRTSSKVSTPVSGSKPRASPVSKQVVCFPEDFVQIEENVLESVDEQEPTAPMDEQEPTSPAAPTTTTITSSPTQLPTDRTIPVDERLAADKKEHIPKADATSAAHVPKQDKSGSGGSRGSSSFKPFKAKTSKLALRYQEGLKKAEMEKTELEKSRTARRVEEEIKGLTQGGISTPWERVEAKETTESIAVVKQALDGNDAKQVTNNGTEAKPTPECRGAKEAIENSIESKPTSESNDGSKSGKTSVIDESVDNASVLDGSMSGKSAVQDSLAIMKLVEENMMAKYTPRRLLPSNAESTLLGASGGATSPFLAANEGTDTPLSGDLRPRTPQGARPYPSDALRQSDLHNFAQPEMMARTAISQSKATALRLESISGQDNTEILAKVLKEEKKEDSVHPPDKAPFASKSSKLAAWYQDGLRKDKAEEENPVENRAIDCETQSGKQTRNGDATAVEALSPSPPPSSSNDRSMDPQPSGENATTATAEDSLAVTTQDSPVVMEQKDTLDESAVQGFILDKTGDLEHTSAYNVWHNHGLLPWRPAQSPEEAAGKPTSMR